VTVLSNRIRTTLAAVAAAAGLAACGGSSHSASTVAQTTSTATAATSTTQATTTTKPAGSGKKKPSAGKAAPSTTTGATTTTTTPAATTAPAGTPPALVANRHQASQLIQCLKASGLAGPSYRGNRIWGGSVGGHDVLVDGPYKSRNAADASAKSLLIVESAERGGLFVVSATLASHLGNKVHQVATCLNGRSTGYSF
jgi:hypothetical protein